MTASINDPDPDPAVEAARLTYLQAQAAADAYYAQACTANGGTAPHMSTEAGWAGYLLEVETIETHDQYLDLWHEAHASQAASEPEPQAGSGGRTGRDVTYDDVEIARAVTESLIERGAPVVEIDAAAQRERDLSDWYYAGTSEPGIEAEP